MSHQVEVVELMKIKSLQEYLEEIRLEREKEAATSSRSLEDVQRLESPGKAEKLKKSSRLAALPSVFYREGRKKQDRLNLNLKTFDEGSSSELPSSQPIIVQDEEISQLNSAEKTEEVTEVPFEKNTEDADDLKTEDNFLELPAFLRLKTARKLSAAKMDCLSCRKYFSHPYIFKHQKICERRFKEMRSSRTKIDKKYNKLKTLVIVK